MSIIQSLIYGLVTGVAEFLPLSSQAHQVILRYMFGVESRNFLQEFLVHIGILLAVIFCCHDTINRFRRQSSVFVTVKHRKKRKQDSLDYYNLRLLKTASFPLVIGLAGLFATVKIENNLLTLIALFIVNALILFLAAHSHQGNRNAKTMTGLDGIIMGILGSLSVFPGISRFGIVSTYTILRGVDIKNATNWAVLISIPALIFFVIFDVVGIVTVGIGTVSISILIGCILSSIAAFCGAYLAISVMLTILNYSGFSYFAYYSIGVAFFTFILYLIT